MARSRFASYSSSFFNHGVKFHDTQCEAVVSFPIPGRLVCEINIRDVPSMGENGWEFQNKRRAAHTAYPHPQVRRKSQVPNQLYKQSIFQNCRKIVDPPLDRSLR